MNDTTSSTPDDGLDQDLDAEETAEPSLPPAIMDRLAEVTAPRRSGRTSRMLDTAAAKAGTCTDAAIVFATPEHAREAMGIFVQRNTGAVSHFPVHYAAFNGTRFWFCTLEDENRVAARTSRAPRFVDHEAVERLLTRTFRETT